MTNTSMKTPRRRRACRLPSAALAREHALGQCVAPALAAGHCAAKAEGADRRDRPKTSVARLELALAASSELENDSAVALAVPRRAVRRL